MSSLRSQLRFARQAYRSARYPGDLAAELLPKDISHRRGRWMIGAAGTAAAAAAAVVVTLLVSRVSNLPRPIHPDDAQREMANWLPSRPAGLPLPKFHSPSVPPSLHLDVPDVVPTMERYQDLAMQYRKLQELAPDLHLKVKVPTLSDLPARSVQWLERVWDADDAQKA